jgi:bifunctional DNA-binding transcriptional regulator/antitoxin component of YhaV-PrlF toxin-antitoxin module
MGVIFNVLLAWILISTSFVLGTRVQSGEFPEKYVDAKSVSILMVEKNFPAETVGLKAGFQIEKIVSGEDVVITKDASGLRKFLKEHPKNIEIYYRKSHGQEVEKTDTFDLREEKGKFLAGVYLADTTEISMPVHKAFYYGIGVT